MFLIQNGFIILTSSYNFSLDIIYLTRDILYTIRHIDQIELFCENLNRQETENFNFDFLRFTYIYHNEMRVKKADG